MPTPDESLVRRVLARNGRDARIRACIEKAWTDVKTKYAERSRWRRKSTTRAVMWEDSVDAVAAALDGEDGVVILPHKDTVSFIADDMVFFRLKKAATSLFTVNFPTPLANLFHSHDADLFGYVGHHRVEIVHVFDRFQTALDWVGVVAREKNRVLWKYELPNRGAAVVTITPTAPITPASDAVLRPVGTPDIKKTDDEAK